MNNPPEEPAAKAQRRTRTSFKVLAVALAFAPFIAFELGLRAFGVAENNDSSDPFAGFGSNIPVFERDGELWRTSAKRMPFLPAQTFPADKPQNGFRVFCFGGSTVHGRPYEAATAFPRWLELELSATHPDRNIEAINCGGVSYASYRIVPMLREILDHSPDLIVVATGHNEFLEDRTYHSLKSRTSVQSWIDNLGHKIRIVRAGRHLLRGDNARQPQGNPDRDGDFETRLDTENGYESYHRDAEWRARVVEQFQEAVQTMVDLCAARDTRLLLVNLGSNVRDCPPFKSEHRSDLTAVEESRWREAFERGSRADTEKSLNHALEAYRAAEAIDDRHALLHWRIARCLDRLGQSDRAKEHYLKAKDEDICPLRMFDSLYAFQTRLAAANNIPLVDARSELERQCTDGIPGNDWYLDHVHPTIGGHQEIARSIAATIHNAGLLPNPIRPWPTEERKAAYADQFKRLGPVYLGNGRRRLEWLEGWANRNRLLEETRPVDARGHLHAGFRSMDFGETTRAKASIKRALEIDPAFSKAWARRRQQLTEQGRGDILVDLP